MKVTLIEPKYFNIWESIGLAYIAAYCKKNFKGALDVDYFQAYFDDDEEIIRGAKDSDVVGFSCTSPTFGHGLRLARRLKKENPKIRTVFGGFHVSALGDEITDGAIDQIVVGEGEKAFLEILEGRTERIVCGESAEFTELPWPDRDVIRNSRTIELCEKMVGLRITSFQANRVCPFRCRFCAEKTVTGVFNRKTNPVRSRDVVDILDEIEHVAKRYALDRFKFVDATFDTTPEYVIRFCEEKVRRGFGLEWECMIHASTASKEIFPWLKKANCGQINVGCESGSPKILKEMRKGTTVEKIIDVFDWAREAGLERRAFFLLGMPSETKEDILLTEKLVERIRPEVFGVTILCPYPGSDLYDPEKMKEIEWAETDEYSNDFWSTEHFTNSELKAWQKYLTEKFRDSLAWHHKFTDDKDVFGEKTR
jgi:radical SAM superfamily enzyme YgiQ (UPF0313 family)